MYSTCSLVNARSFSFAGSTFANRGILRRTSRSRCSVIVRTPASCRRLQRSLVLARLARRRVRVPRQRRPTTLQGQRVLEMRGPFLVLECPDHGPPLAVGENGIPDHHL